MLMARSFAQYSFYSPLFKAIPGVLKHVPGVQRSSQMPPHISRKGISFVFRVPQSIANVNFFHRHIQTSAYRQSALAIG
jgi:hypothetical protein